MTHEVWCSNYIKKFKGYKLRKVLILILLLDIFEITYKWFSQSESFTIVNGALRTYKYKLLFKLIKQ